MRSVVAEPLWEQGGAVHAYASGAHLDKPSSATAVRAIRHRRDCQLTVMGLPWGGTGHPVHLRDALRCLLVWT